MTIQLQNMALPRLPYRENLLHMRFADANVIRSQANLVKLSQSRRVGPLKPALG